MLVGLVRTTRRFEGEMCEAALVGATHWRSPFASHPIVDQLFLLGFAVASGAFSAFRSAFPSDPLAACFASLSIEVESLSSSDPEQAGLKLSTHPRYEPKRKVVPPRKDMADSVLVKVVEVFEDCVERRSRQLLSQTGT